MDLWIRSQDKRELVLAHHFEVEQFSDDEVSVNVNCYSLGVYKTKKRALEVLDEIQRCVNGKPIIKVRNTGNYKKVKENFIDSGFIIVDHTIDVEPVNTMVYEMPQE